MLTPPYSQTLPPKGNQMNIVLHRPEIPHNTGAIGRTCLVAGARLHLIRPYGFHLDEKSLLRSGLDYWHKLDVSEYDSFQEFIEENPTHRLFLVETVSGKTYSEACFEPGDYLMFGGETVGLPHEILGMYPENVVQIPMVRGERSLNLSVAVGIVLYEALRQGGFEQFTWI